VIFAIRAGRVADTAYRDPMTVPPPEGYQPPPYNPGQPQSGPPVYPGQPAYPPGYGYGPVAPEKKKSNTLRTVLIIGGIVAILCCGGLAAGGIWLASTVKNSIGPARDKAVAFVQDLESDDASGAYDQLCPATQARFPREVFIAGVGAQPKIVSHSVNGMNVNSTNGLTTATVDMGLTQEGGFVDQHTFRLVKENGTWYVCGNPY
jgi:hypothetical protein